MSRSYLASNSPCCGKACLFWLVLFSDYLSFPPPSVLRAQGPKRSDLDSERTLICKDSWQLHASRQQSAGNEARWWCTETVFHGPSVFVSVTRSLSLSLSWHFCMRSVLPVSSQHKSCSHHCSRPHRRCSICTLGGGTLIDVPQYHHHFLFSSIAASV